MRSVTLLSIIMALPSPFLATAKIVVIRSTGDAPFFDPTSTTADVGDVLEFHFKAHNRSIVRGDYQRPCEPWPAATGGFYSGFFVEDGSTREDSTVFRVTVNDTDPIVYYCSQSAPGFGNHCKEHGMAGVVNEPDPSRLQGYRDAAGLVSTSLTPDSEPFGGVFAVNPDAAATTAASGTASASLPGETSTSTAGDTSTSAARGGWTCRRFGLVLAAVTVVFAL